MIMHPRSLLALAAALLLGALTAQAHRIWILPGVTVLSGTDQWVSVDAAVSNNLFFPNHRGVSLEQVEVFAPNGSTVELQNGATGRIRSAFELHLQQQGTYRISLKPGMGRRPGGGAGDLFGSYEEAGQVKRWRGTPETLAAEGMAAKPGFKLRESGGRKVVTFVTLGNPSTENLKVEGKGIEVEYLTHPNDLFTGDAASFRVLLDGQPAAKAEVAVVLGDDRYRNEAGETVLHTGDNGVVTINWPQSGRYWIEITATTTGQLHGVPSEKVFTYVATFEVLPE